MGLALICVAGCRWVHVVQYELKTQVVEYSARVESPRTWSVSGRTLDLETAALDEKGFQGALVLQSNELIFEWYADGYGPNSIFNIKSISKSLLSALVGIAIADGKLDLDEKVSKIGPCEVPSRLQGLTPRHLLTMSAGFRFVENQDNHVFAGDSWSCEILGLPVEAENGERFNYGTAQSYLLGAHLEKRIGVPLETFFAEKLFEPIGISLKGWRIGPESIPFAGSEMRLTARDVLAFGQLYLERGRYQGRQVIPEPWVEQSFSTVWPQAIKGFDYGWSWWKTSIADFEFLAALGFGGQTLFINRDLGLVIVTTAPTNHHDERVDAVRQLVEEVVGIVTGREAVDF